MITRRLIRQIRFASSQASISAAPPSSGSGGSSNFQHPHAALEETAKNDLESSQATQRAASSQDGPSTDPEHGLVVSNPIIPRDIDNSEPYITPFHTYKFFVALEQTFPTPIARTLMRLTRGLLVDRMMRIRRDALDVKDLDNQAYLFKAALSELRTEATMRTKNQAATITTSISGLRRDVDRLDVKMKEDIGNLKHEIQMEMDNHRNESRAEMKKLDIRMEDVVHRATVSLGDIRTIIEQAKWDNTRRGVAIFGSFVLLTVIMMELKPSKPSSYPPKVAVDAANSVDVVETQA
ncbi:SubName: Full=Related to COX10-farnesyl transferase {ECO:0000313/EMBL:CCA67282.1} [Serendipita indica DSM 11827]|uniref:Related to COX10-farnesyl transferase n=1 Tax=Serendipita indica (strain DSM 11827) TaxID=1109443 RepID=G4T7F0_SERID|nr:SubName: Full=Related to COX10-farnesyl transferase {ECO:0000313/EMBL:CCA67282.1} [Serendipita indica DSM 11827]CCA67282.1 related to COX10-farnesyl transferase [Serendipita indica DSM 11827]